MSFHCHLSAHAQFTSPHPTFFLFRDALVKQQTITYITMNGINIVAPPVTSKRRQRLFPAWDTFIGVDLAGLLGGRMASAEGGSVRSGVGYGEGCPLSTLQPTKGSGGASYVSSPSGVRGRTPAENGFWRILKATERLFLYLYDKIWGGGQFALASPRSKFWGGLSPLFLPPRDLRLWIHFSKLTADFKAQLLRTAACV